jgi:hypothetical protein
MTTAASRVRSKNGISQQLVGTLRWFVLVVVLVIGRILWLQLSVTQYDSSSLRNVRSSAESCMDLPSRPAAASVNTSTATSLERTVSTSRPPVEHDACMVEYQRVTAQRTRGLTAEDLERSRALMGNRYRLAQVARSLQHRQRPITVAVCGGSISLGHGVHPGNLRYSDRLEVWLNEQFPIATSSMPVAAEGAQQPAHKVYNKGSHGADVSLRYKRGLLTLCSISMDLWE